MCASSPNDCPWPGHARPSGSWARHQTLRATYTWPEIYAFITTLALRVGAASSIILVDEPGEIPAPSESGFYLPAGQCVTLRPLFTSHSSKALPCLLPSIGFACILVHAAMKRSASSARELEATSSPSSSSSSSESEAESGSELHDLRLKRIPSPAKKPRAAPQNFEAPSSPSVISLDSQDEEDEEESVVAVGSDSEDDGPPTEPTSPVTPVKEILAAQERPSEDDGMTADAAAEGDQAPPPAATIKVAMPQVELSTTPLLLPAGVSVIADEDPLEDGGEPDLKRLLRQPR